MSPGCPHPSKPYPLWRALGLPSSAPFSSQFWQLFNALTLFNLARDPQCKEWQVSRAQGTAGGPATQARADSGLPQVLMCGLPFLLLFLGNFFTTLRVVHQKFHSQWRGSKKE